MKINNQHKIIASAFVEGFAILAIELLLSQKLIPEYGTSLFVWCVILSMTGLALLSGYFLGGKISTSSNYKSRISHLFFASSILVLAIPLFSPSLFKLSNLLTENLISQAIISVFLIAYIPLLLISSASPLLVKSYGEDSTKYGNSAGNVFTISTAGGILGAFVVGFYLLDAWGSTIGFYAVSALLLHISLLINDAKISIKVGQIILFVVLLFLVIKNEKKPENEIYFSEGLLGDIRLLKVKNNGGNLLMVNKMGQTWENENGDSRWTYPNYMRAILINHIGGKDALLFGLGGGTIGKMMINNLKYNLDVVELDKRFPQIAERYFNYPKNQNNIIDDARHFINTNQKKYNVIVFDICKGETFPYQCFTYESFQKLKNSMNKDAAVVLNFNGFTNIRQGRGTLSVIKTLVASGYFIKIVPTLDSESDRNLLIVASENPKVTETLTQNLRLLNINELNLEYAYILKDDKPILDFLNTNASIAWRKSYKNLFD